MTEKDVAAYVELAMKNLFFAKFQRENVVSEVKGHSFRLYEKSAMLDYVESETITIPYWKASHDVSKTAPLTLSHYEICTMNSIISVVTEYEPMVEIVIIWRGNSYKFNEPNLYSRYIGCYQMRDLKHC